VSKSRKIVEARAIVSRCLSELETGLAKSLNPKQLASLQSLNMVRSGLKILATEIMGLDPDFKAKLDSLVNNRKD